MGVEVGAVALLADGADDAAEVAKLRRFDLNHLRAHIGEDQRRLRALLKYGEIQDTDTFQRSHCGSFRCDAPLSLQSIVQDYKRRLQVAARRASVPV